MWISVYNDADYLSALKQKRKIFTVFLSITLFYAAFCIAWWIYFLSLPYASPKGVLPKLLVYVATAIYVVFLFPFMGIKYKRISRYCKMLYFVGEGIKAEEKYYFYQFREKTLQKDNIDVISAVFAYWDAKTQEWREREVYCDAEKPLPQIESGDYVRYLTQSNFIVQYEVLVKRAYDFFEEYEEDEEDEAGGTLGESETLDAPKAPETDGENAEREIEETDENNK